MLKALDASGKYVLAWEAGKGRPYWCPGCREGVILKRGTIVTPHFAHRPYSSCSLVVGESLRHLEMKRQIGNYFEVKDYEVPLPTGHRADLVVVQNELRFIVECQASPISIEEWSRRNRDYHEAGLSVLWVWDIARVVGRKHKTFDEVPKNQEFRIPAEIRHCYKESGYKLYVLDASGTLAGCSLLKPAARYYPGNDYYPDKVYVPGTLRVPVFYSLEVPLRPMLRGTQDGFIVVLEW